LTVRFLDSLLSSASTDVIGVAHWWDRATSALRTAAARAGSYADAVSIACRKLQVDQLSEPSARALTALEPQIAPHLQAWKDLASRDAVYLVALTRVLRANRQAQKGNNR
jgi:hypothetical protein